MAVATRCKPEATKLVRLALQLGLAYSPGMYASSRLCRFVLWAATAAFQPCLYAAAISPAAPVLRLFEDFEVAVPAECVVADRGIGGSRCYRYLATTGQRNPAPMLLDLASPLDAVTDTQRLTITGWFRRKIDALLGEHQCILSCPSRFALFCHGDYPGRLGLSVHDASGGRSAAWSSWFRTFLAQDEWVFFAITCDLGQAKENVAFYVGTVDAEVVLDGRASMASSAIQISSTDRLIVGASDLAGSQPFRGMLDNLCVHVGGDGSPAVPMTLTDIESVRLDDLRRAGPAGSQATRPAEDAIGAGKTPEAAQPFAAVEIGTLQQIFTDLPSLPYGTTGPTHVPRRAKACFQFAVSSTAAGLCYWRVSPIMSRDGEQLRGQVKPFVLLPVHVEANSNGGARSGVGRRPPGTWRKFQMRVAPFDVAEVMLEANACELRAGRTTSVLLEVDVPPDATPGAYGGSMRFEQETYTASVGFSLQVHETTLPSNATLSTTYWLSPAPEDLTRRVPPSWWSEQHWRLIENSARALRAFGQDSIRTPLISGTEPLIRTLHDADHGYTFDFARFDRWCETFLRLGFRRLEGEHIAGGHRLTMPPAGRSFYVWDSVTQERSPLFTRESTLKEWYAFLPRFISDVHNTARGSPLAFTYHRTLWKSAENGADDLRSKETLVIGPRQVANSEQM